MHYDQISAELEAKGYEFARYDEVLEAVAREYKMLDRHGEMTRPFSASQIAEIYHRLDAEREQP